MILRLPQNTRDGAVIDRRSLAPWVRLWVRRSPALRLRWTESCDSSNTHECAFGISEMTDDKTTR
jgi:hypothetical protein